MQKYKKYSFFILILVSIISWSLLMYYIGTETVVNTLGISNSYLVVFLVALFGGTSILTATLYYSTLITVASGGLNIYLLGIIVGAALTIGDIVFYYFGIAGSRVLPKSFDNKLHKFSGWLKNKPKWVVPVFILFYAGLIPLPNDLLSITLAVTKQKFKTIILPIFVGNITLVILMSYLSQKGIEIFN